MIHPVRFIHHTKDAEQTGLFRRWDNYSKVVVVTDKNTSRDAIPHFKNTFVNKPFLHLDLPYLTEDTKNISTIEKIVVDLLRMQADRKTAIVALGGGVVSDTVGFAASVYKRGLHLYYIPTTLLSMVDAALGGKNGVNFHNIKNQIGTFYLPREVIIDPAYLSTLAREEWLSGYAEMLKHGLIADVQYFDTLTTNLQTGRLENHIGRHIARSVEIKMKVVQEDFKETGKRKVLNFGHTVGHALEACARDHQIKLLHGHAVALGMAVETALSVQYAGLDEGIAKNIIQRLLSAYPLPEKISPDIIHCVLDTMKHDKKNTSGTPSFVLLQKPGHPVWDKKIPGSVIREKMLQILFGN